mmetsp:Transcript_12082/g.48650  ORF Transcript_12082/g.48650 Transcript_12082/m.48650 type:complete len:338 (+) Transcript_12082:4-1017(+)
MAVTLEDVVAASERVRPFVERTPVLTCTAIDELVGCKVFFKCENFQKIGAFKIRGAMNTLLSLQKKLGIEELRRRGVVTHSSGNHAQALACAAQIMGITAYIVMPSNSPTCKLNAVRDTYKAVQIVCDPTAEARAAAAEKVVQEKGAIFCPSYNKEEVIAGQGTLVLELLEQVQGLSKKPLDAIMTPVGGGGLISGCSVAAKGSDGSIRVFGAEPVLANDAKRGLESGTYVPLTGYPGTIADGLRTSLGDLTWPLIQANVDHIFEVKESEIAEALRLVFERMKIVIEPSSAVPVAAALSPAFREVRERLGVQRLAIVISGGNIDLDAVSWPPNAALS